MSFPEKILGILFRDKQSESSQTGKVVATQRDVIIHDKTMHRSFEYYDNCRFALKEALVKLAKKQGIKIDYLEMSAEVDATPDGEIPGYCQMYGARPVISYPPSDHIFGS